MGLLLAPEASADSLKSILKRNKHKMYPPANKPKSTATLAPTPPPPGYGFKFYELTSADDSVVRTLQAPTQTDSQGNTKKYSPEELKKLKGPDPDAVGYPSNYDNLIVGQIVKVYLKKSADEKAEPSSAGDMLTGRLAVVENSTKKLTVRVQYLLGKGKEKADDEKEVVLDKVANLIVIVDPQPGEVVPVPPAKK
jgi:hypothetical protein